MNLQNLAQKGIKLSPVSSNPSVLSVSSLASKGIKLTPIQSQQNGFQKTMSAMQNFGTGLDQSIGSTIQGAGTLTQEGMDKTVGRLVNWVLGKGFNPTSEDNLYNPQSSQAKAFSNAMTPKGSAQTAGKITGDVGQFFIPSSAEEETINSVSKLLPKASELFVDSAGNLSKIGKAAEYGIRSLVKGASAAGVTSAQTGNLKQGLETGGLVGLLETPLALGGKLLGGILKNVASFTSGKGRDVINAIVSDPDTALQGLKEDTASGLRKSSLAIKKYASDMYEAVKYRYSKGLEDIEKKYLPSNEDFIKQGNNIISPQGKIPLTLNGVKNKITSIFSDFGVDGNFKDGFNFDNASGNYRTVLNNIYNKVKNFTDITPTGLNNLTRSLQDMANRTRVPEAMNVANQVASNMRQYLGERIPEIKPLNEDYAKVSQFLENLDNYLSTGTKGDIKAGMKTEEGIVQTANKIAGLFGQNKELARQFISGIPGGSKVISEQAGRLIAEGQKLSGFAGGGGILQRALESAIPSKLTGWLTARASQFSGILGKLSPVEQGIIRELFGYASGENQKSSPQFSSSGRVQNSQRLKQSGQ